MGNRDDRTWVEISRSALAHNLRAVQRLVGSVPIAPVVKANAYGHGLSEIMAGLRSEKIWGVCVADGREALELRRQYRGRILVLSFWQPGELPRLVHQGIDLVVWDHQSLAAVRRLPPALGRRARIHLKLDSGTSRLGFLPNQLSSLRRDLHRSRIRPVAIFSHLANSEELGLGRTRNQIIRFTTLVNLLGLDRGILTHLACTAAALRYPEARFGLIRLGLGLYGLWPSAATKRVVEAKNPWFRLKPVLAWASRLSQVKTVPAGTSIGYGSTVTVKRPTRIGTIPIGYADGYRRMWSNRSWVMIHGHRAPVIGRVSMNVTTVNLERVPRPSVGDETVLLGRGVSAEDVARRSSSINYEVTTSIASTIRRILL